MKKVYLLLTAFILFAFVSKGQGVNTVNLLHQNLSLLNPAHYGSDKQKTVFLDYRKQWTGIPNSPEQLSVLMEGSFRNKKIGLGLLFENNEVGALTRTNFGLGYRYKLKFTEVHHLQFGIQAGVERTNIDFSRIQADDPSELNSFQTLQAKIIGRFTGGVQYYFKKLAIGLSANVYAGQSLSYQDPITQNEMIFNKAPFYAAYAKYELNLGANWKYTPTVSVISTQGLPFFIDNSHTFRFKDNMDFGVGYRQTNNLYGHVGILLLDQVKVSYAYQRNVTNLGTIFRNSHEIGLKLFLKSGNSASRSNGSAKSSDSEKRAVIQEQLDNNTIQIKELRDEVDSLKVQKEKQQKEIENLKLSQLSTEQVQKVLNENEFPTTEFDEKIKNESEVIKIKTYEMVSVNSAEDISRLKNDAGAFYSIVLGAYRPLASAKAFRSLLKRKIDLDTKLQSVEIGGRLMILVILPTNYEDVAIASEDLIQFRKENHTKYDPYLNGEPWLLKMKK